MKSCGKIDKVIRVFPGMMFNYSVDFIITLSALIYVMVKTTIDLSGASVYNLSSNLSALSKKDNKSNNNLI